MIDIDAALTRLKDLPADSRLEYIDGAVLEALDFQRRHGFPLSSAVFSLTAGLALMIGLASSVFPGRDVRTASIAPFGAPSALAPSTLLGTGE